MPDLPLQHRPCEGIRVDSDKDGLDDLAISGEHIKLVHIERMDKDAFWARIDLKDGKDSLVLWFTSKNKITATVSED